MHACMLHYCTPGILRNQLQSLLTEVQMLHAASISSMLTMVRGLMQAGVQTSPTWTRSTMQILPPGLYSLVLPSWF